MNPRNHADIMMLAPESDDADAHPFVYARILGIYHADVIEYNQIQNQERP
jgi:hypothetical protein